MGEPNSKPYNDLSENLFRSIDTIVSSRIESLPYDKTIECYITNNDKAAQGIYKVKYQNAEFEAVSDITDFKINERVYVQIPLGDFDEDKIIIRKKQLEEKRQVKKLPFLSMAKSKNFFTEKENAETYLLEITPQESIGKNVFVWDDDIWAGYTKLGFKASIMTDLPYTIISGDYGVKIEITSFDQTTTPNNFSSADKTTDVYYLQIKDMIGTNFFNTHGFQNQEKVIDITNKVISAIKISLWQNGEIVSKEYGAIKNNFIYYTNLQLYIGYDISEFDNSNTQLFLYSQDGLQYSVNLNSKTLQTRLLTLDKNSLFFTEQSDLFAQDTNLKSYWGKYNVNNYNFSNVFNQIAFEEINNNITFKNYVELSTIRNRMKEQFICAIGSSENNILYRSKILTFDNITYLASSNILDIITGLQVSVAEGNGIYQIYGQDNIATNKIVTSSPHYLLVNYISSNEESDNNGLRPDDIIIWKIPKYNTMIIAPRVGIEYEENPGTIEGCTEDENYWIVTQIIRANKIDNAGVYRIPFYINDYYSPQKTNNTIICQLQRNFDTYETSKELIFGTSGSQGNEYNFRLKLWQYDPAYENGKKYVNAYYLTTNINTPYFLDAELYDYDNNQIEINKINYKLLYNSDIGIQFILDNSIVSTSDTQSLYNYYNNSGTITTYITEAESITNTPYICLKRVDPSDNLLRYFSNVIEGTIEINGNEYKSYLPIAVTATQNNIAISGSTVITYDITGKKPFYTKTPFQLKQNNTSSNNLNWHIYSYYNNTTDINWIPKLFPENNNLESITKKELIPPTIFKKDSNQKFALVCTREDIITSDNWQDTSIIEWIQPIHIIQNKYPGAMENGEINYAYINNTQYIANTMVGRVNIDADNPNTMSGLFMGVLGDTENNTENFGLYAYRQGRQFFCIDENGHLFLDGGLNQSSRIANITLNKCKLEDNFFDFTEDNLKNDVNVIVIKDNSQQHKETITINSSGNIKINDLQFQDMSVPSLVSNKISDREPDQTSDTAYFYGTAAFADKVDNSNNSALARDLKKIKKALKELGKDITDFEWIS